MPEMLVSEAEARLGLVEDSIGTVWVFHSILIVLSMQLGFALLEAGCVRKMNLVNILSKNMCDMGIGGFAFWAVGYRLAFYEGNSFGGWAAPAGAGERTDQMNFFAQLAFAVTSTTIISGCCAETVKFTRYLAWTAFNLAVVYPLPAHWVWGTGGWLADVGPWGAIDAAGSCVVHLGAAMSSLVVLKFTGGRHAVENAEGQRVVIHGSSPTTVMLGTLFLWIGWFAFNTGATGSLVRDQGVAAGHVLFSTTLGGSAGLFAGLVHTLTRHRGHEVFEHASLCNGVLGGLVSITAGCTVMTGWSNFMVGLVGGVLACVVPGAALSRGIDDPVNVLGVHGACGLFGTLAVGLFAHPELLESYYGASAAEAQVGQGLLYGGGLQLLGIQALAAASTMLWHAALATLFFFAVSRQFGLVVDDDCGLVGLDVVEHNCASMIIAELEAVSQEKQLERQAVVNQYTNFKHALVDNSAQLFKTFSDLAPVGIFHTSAAGAVLFVNGRFCELAHVSEHTARTRGWVSSMHPEDRSRIQTEWNLRTNLNQPFSDEWRFVSPVNGQVTWVLGRAVPIALNASTGVLDLSEHSGGSSLHQAASTYHSTSHSDASSAHGAAPRQYFGTVTDITASKMVEAQLRWREHQQEVVASLGLEALDDANTHRLVERMSPLISQTLRITTCYITAINEQDSSVYIVAGIGVHPSSVGSCIGTVAAKSFTSEVIRSKEPVTAADMHHDARFSPGSLVHLRGQAVVSGLGVYVQNSGRVVGTIEVFSPEPREFTREDTRFLQSFANVLGTAVEKERTALLAEEKNKSETLLFNLLPKDVAIALKEDREVTQAYDDVTVLFTDIVGFTSLCDRIQPEQVVDLLNQQFSAFDALTETNGVYKVETIGDAYMVAGGLQPVTEDHAARTVNMAFDMLEATAGILDPLGRPLQIRVGVHSGPVVAGVVGRRFPRYTVFGDTVTRAQALESGGASMRIHVSAETAALLERSTGYEFLTEHATADTFFVTGRRRLRSAAAAAAAASADRRRQSPTGSPSPFFRVASASPGPGGTRPAEAAAVHESGAHSVHGTLAHTPRSSKRKRSGAGILRRPGRQVAPTPGPAPASGPPLSLSLHGRNSSQHSSPGASMHSQP